MKNVKFMRQTRKKRKKRFTAIMKRISQLSDDEIRRIVRMLPLDRQLLINTVDKDTLCTLQQHKMLVGEHYCLISTENMMILYLMK